MSIELDKVTSEALALSPSDRAALAARIVESIDRKDAAATAESHLDEAERRLEEVRSGKVKTVAASEVSKNLRNRFKH